MSLHEAFLADIGEHAEDDAPRLVYADWLEDNGDPERAEFIRVQCELARLDRLSRPLSVLDAREAELLRRNEARWSEPLRRLGVEWWLFRRGFIEAVALQGEDFIRDSTRLFELAPVRDLTLFQVHRCANRLTLCPDVARPETLRLCGNGSSGSGQPHGYLLERLLKGRIWPRLRTLELRELSYDIECSRFLPGLTTLTGLTELGLPRTGIDTVRLAALVHAPLAAQLEALDLRGNYITDTGLQALAAANLPRLRWLNLEGNPIGDAGITALLDSPRLSCLRHIGCDTDRLSPAVLERVKARARRGESPHP